MSSRVIAADRVITILEGCDAPDLDFVLSCVDSRFPRGNRGPKNQGRGRGGGRIGNRGRGGRGNIRNVARPPSYPAAQPTHGYGGAVASVYPDGVIQGASVPPAVAETEDFLPEVLSILEGIIPALPEVSRDSSADKPIMTRKSVQTRLNKKRAELQKVLGLFYASSVDKYWCFESLNGIQKFRLAAADAIATAGVRLRTNPLPPDFHELITPMEVMILERTEANEVSVCGFFSNEDRIFNAPTEHQNDGN